MVITVLKDTYLGGTTPTALKNEVSIFRKMYYDRETRVMVNQSVNEFTPNSSLKLMNSLRMSHLHWTLLQPS